MYNKTVKLLISVILSLSLLMSMTACGNGKTADYDLEQILTETAEMMISGTDEPGFGSIGGEWQVFGLSRWGGTVPENWFDSYYKNIEEYVKLCDGKLDEKKYTEYSRVIIALTAIGKDPADVAGYNLIQPLADFDGTVFQGTNGPVYALLALDIGNYDIPSIKSEGTQATRDMYIDYILNNEAEGGGWSFAGGPAEADMTATVLQALSKYQSRKDVAEAVDRGVELLSEMQDEEGGYSSYDVSSSEIVSQVIVALTELGISIDDSRFVKNGNSLVDCLMGFRAEDNGFKHVQDGESNMLATEQAFYALTALYRAEQGMPSLYTSDSAAATDAADACLITIEGYCSQQTVEINSGDSVYDILKKTGVSVSARKTGYGLYIEGIDGRFEFDEGPTSGWVYTVNGERVSDSCDKFEVKAGDEIIWTYVEEI